MLLDRWPYTRLSSVILWFALLAALFGNLEIEPAAAQQPPPPVLEASRHNLSYGRYDGLRYEGLAGIAPDLRPGKFYRNVPGITGPAGLFAVISQERNPSLITLTNPVIATAGRWLPPGFSLVVLENAVTGGFVYNPQNFMRFGEGNFYATVAIAGTDIVPGMELVTVEQFAAYTANSILWEAPDIGNIVQETTISGGTVDVGAIIYPASRAIGTITVGGVPYRRHLGYANPLEVNIEIVNQRQLPNGSCQVRLRAALSPTFGNAIAGVPQSTYTWFRWAIEDNNTLITDVAGVDTITVVVPLVPGENVSDQVGITVVASTFGPAVVAAPLPGVTLWTNPFIEPQAGPPNAVVGLDTFHSTGSTLGDTETVSHGDCDKQPLLVTKDADPGTVPAEGGDVTYWVTVRNTSNKDPVTVNTLTDDRLGDLAADCSPPLPVTLPPGGSINCRVTRRITGAAESTVTNTVRATGGYTDDNTPVEAVASTSVEIGAAAPVAACNSAVEAGGDAGGGVSVDLGNFAGKAGFTWEMYTIKDRMDVTVGGIQKTTGCVSGSGTFEIDIPPGAGSAQVKVIPNCENTTGTQWTFTFECPLSSTVTADGTGTATGQPGAGSTVTSGATGTRGPTGLGAPVTPAPLPPAPIGPTGHASTETEANDTVASATAIAVGDTVTGYISQVGDADFYTIDLPYQGELTVSFLAAPPGLDMAFRVLDANGTEVRGWQASPNTGAAYSAWVDIKSPGAYAVEVRDSYNNAGSQSPYTLQMTFVPAADTGEPNDTLASSTPVGWNQAIAANILPIGDADYYKVQAARQGRLTVSFPVVPPALDMAFRILDASGSEIHGWLSPPQAGTPFSASADIRTPGEYVIEVRDSYNNARDAASYQMFVSLDQTADPAEPNDDISRATPLLLDVPLSASILPVGDADLYAVALTHQGELTVTFPKAPAGLDMAFRILDMNGREVRGWQASSEMGKPYAASVDVKEPGNYLIEVRDSYNNARSEQDYTIIASLIPTRDPAEPNDTIAEATAIPFGVGLEASILPIGDADFYRIRMANPGELKIDFTRSPDGLDMAFRVLDASGQEVRGWQASPAMGKPYSAQAEFKMPGDYVIEVRDSYNNARSAEPYSLTVRP